MSLGYQTTKNEDNKKFYWIRLMIDFFHKDTMDFLMGQKDGANYVALYMMLLLMSANTNGKLQTEIGEIIVPVNIDKIVRDTKYFSKDTVIVGLELFKKLGLVYEDNNGILVLPEVPYLVGVSSGQTIRKSNALIDKEVKGGKSGGKNYHKSIEYRDKSIIDKDIKEDKRFKKPTIEEIKEYCIERKNNIDAEQFFNFYESKGWLVGKNSMKDWKASVRTWEKRNQDKKEERNELDYGDIFKGKYEV